MTDDDLTIPAFLIMSAEEREAAWKRHPPKRHKEPLFKDPYRAQHLAMKKAKARARLAKFLATKGRTL